MAIPIAGALAIAVSVAVAVPVVVAVAITVTIALSNADNYRIGSFNIFARLSKQNNRRLNLTDFAIVSKKLDVPEESELPVPDAAYQPNYLISRKHRAFKGGTHLDQTRATAKAGVPCPDRERLPSGFN